MTLMPSIAHPFILADNRHYTFYIWRYFLQNEIVRICLAPVYLFCGYAVISALAASHSALWLLLFGISVILVLAPTPLLEFRYYIIPFIIARTNITKKKTRLIFLEMALYFIVNFVTVFLFIYRPFSWKHEQGVQRFMW